MGAFASSFGIIIMFRIQIWLVMVMVLINLTGMNASIISRHRVTRGHSGVIAFHAGISFPQINLGSQAVVVFGKIYLNSGSAYDASTGIFTAPEDGVYYFTWTILTSLRKTFSTVIVLNGDVFGFNYVDGKAGSPNSASGSSSAVIGMKKNDRVWIKAIRGAAELALPFWSSFSGFKL